MIAVAAIKLSDLFAVVMLFGVYSLLTAVVFMDLDAVDVAFTEAAVGAGVTTVLMLSSLHLTKRWEALPRRKPLLGLLVVCVAIARRPDCADTSTCLPALHRAGCVGGRHAQSGDRCAGKLQGLRHLR